MDCAVHTYLRASVANGRDIERIGPFLASFSRSTANPYLNYAIPDDGAAPSEADIAGLSAVYQGRGLRPRLEYLPRCAPLVEAALLAGGFSVEGRLALMFARSDVPSAPRIPDGFELIRPETDEQLRDVRVVQYEAYDDPDPIGQAQVDRFRASLAEGAGAVLARVAAGGEAVGAGEFTVPIGGISEVTSIAVREPFRRRGVATAMTAWLLREARAAGVTTPFLMANEAEERIYSRVGFETTSQILHISLQG